MATIDSGYERKLFQLFNKIEAVEWKPDALEINIPHRYHPDFKVKVGSKSVLVEAKGVFKDKGEPKKYKAVRESLKRGDELVFLLQNPKAGNPLAGRRKDRTRQSMAEWCERNKFRWFTVETFTSFLISEGVL